MIPIGADDILPFDCSPDNICFNACCRDLNQFLTPYDILRLKNYLQMTSHDFLKTYTSLHTGPGSGLPVLEFKPNPDTGYACPFVSESGCTVYDHRPGSCRMYPLARAVSRSRETGLTTEYFALIEEDHCKGFGGTGQRTVREWLATQGVDSYNRANDKLMEIISLKNTIRPGKLEGNLADQFYMALYDLDTFREEIFTHDLLRDITVPDRVRAAMGKDDEALLEFAVEWVKWVLFGKEILFDDDSGN